MWYGKIVDGFNIDGHNITYYFDDILVSFEERVCKPDTLIFERAIHKFGINPSETIFFDDSIRNIEAAAASGFNGIHVKDATPFESLINVFFNPVEGHD